MDLFRTSPGSFESLKVGSGFVLYETVVDKMVTDPAVLSVPELKDRAYVFVNKVSIRNLLLLHGRALLQN